MWGGVFAVLAVAAVNNASFNSNSFQVSVLLKASSSIMVELQLAWIHPEPSLNMFGKLNCRLIGFCPKAGIPHATDLLT